MTAAIHAVLATALLAVASAQRLDAQHNVRFTLTGGPHAGSYELTEAAMCDVVDVSPNEVEISAYFEADRPKGWRDHPDRPYAARFALSKPKTRGGTPAMFSLGTGFATPKDRHRIIRYVILTIPRELQEPGLEEDPEGRGEVAVQRTAGGATATFGGETKDGVRIEGALECGT